MSGALSAVAGGTDLQLAWTMMKKMTDRSSAVAVTNLREASHNILYTVANSNAMDGIAPGDTVVYHRAWWEWAFIAATALIGGLFLFGLYRVARRVRRYSAARITIPAGERVTW